MRPARPALLALALCSILVGAGLLRPTPAPAQGAVRTLSALQPLGGTVRQVQIAGDDAIYLADFEVLGRFDLSSAPLAGGPVVRLSAALPPGTIEAFTPAGAYVVVELTPESADRRGLYSVPLRGGPAVMLFPPTIDPNKQATRPETAVADGWLVYRFDHDGAGAPQLYSAPLGGGPPIRLSAGQAGGVTAMQVSADGGTVAYTLAPPGGPPQIYAVAPDGGDRALISGAAPPVAPGTGFALTPDGGAVVYVGASDPPGRQRLQQVARGGQAARTIAEHESIGFLLMPDGVRVIYWASDSGMPARVWRSAPLSGGSPIALDIDAGAEAWIGPGSASAYFWRGAGLYQAPVAGGDRQTVWDASQGGVHDLRFSEDGTWLVLEARPYLYAYDTSVAGEPYVLWSTAEAEPYVPGRAGPYAVTGDHLVYWHSSEGLLLVPLGGGGQQRLARTDWSLPFAAFDGHVVFVAEEGRQHLRHSVAATSAVNSIDAARAMASNVASFGLSPADGAALYLADQERLGLPDLYRVPIAGGPPVRLNEPMDRWDVGYTEIAEVFPAPAGGWVLYEVIGHVYSTELFSLWSAPIGGGTPTRIIGVNYARGARTLLSPNSAMAVIHSWQDLYRVPLSGGPVTRIDSADPPPRAQPTQISPDGAYVVYVTSVETPREIRSAPLAGGDPVTLGPITEGPFQISPDSRLVVYAQPTVGLVAQPVGGGPATPLPLLGPGEALGDWAITPDSAAVVSTARSAAGTALRRLPLAGGPATTLATAAAGATMRFTLPPQSDRALFTVAGPGAAPAHTLASVPLAGGPPVTLAGPFASAGFSLAEVAVSPDGAFAAIRAEDGLFAVATAGGALARLDDPADPGAVAAFAPTADGRVVFSAGGALWLSDRYGALRQRIDGAHPDRTVQAFALAGPSVVFLGETVLLRSPVVSSVRELFAVDLPPVTSLLGVGGAGRRLQEADPAPAVEIVLAAPQPRTVTVPYTVSGGTARAGLDYRLGAGPLVFAPGETRQRLPLTVLPRAGFQGRRTLTLSLTDPSPWANEAGATVAPAVVVVTITITDEAAALLLPLMARQDMRR